MLLQKEKQSIEEIGKKDKKIYESLLIKSQ